ncbi:MAG: hypothetical protein ACE5FN_01255 [Leptospirillia bacterium]
MSDLKITTESFKRSLEAPDLFEQFLTTLQTRIPEVSSYFEGADTVRLKALSRKAVTTILMDAAGSPAAARDLARILDLHGPENLNLNPAWFPIWIESMLSALSKCDPEYRPATDAAWRRILAVGVAKVTPASF